MTREERRACLILGCRAPGGQGALRVLISLVGTGLRLSSGERALPLGSGRRAGWLDMRMCWTHWKLGG